jgi:hypothetical protein
MKRRLSARQRCTSPRLSLVPVVIAATLGFAMAVSSPPAAGAEDASSPGVPPALISIIPTSYGALVTWSPGSSEDDGIVLSLCNGGHVSTAPTESFISAIGTVVSEPPSPSRLSAKFTTMLLDDNFGNWQSQWFEIYVGENGLPVWSQHCLGVGATAPTLPTTSVVHPASGARLQGTSVPLVATASASNGLSIASVKFVLAGGFGNQITICSAAWLFGYWWGQNCDVTGMAGGKYAPPDGTYTLRSYATDASGNSAYSPDVTITVRPGCHPHRRNQRCRARL